MRQRRAELLVLAIDIGSSSTRTSLFDSRGQRLIASSASEEYSVRYTREGGAELSPLVLKRAVRRCCAKTLRARNDVAAIGGSALWHALLGLDRQSRPITPIFTWADSRAVEDARALRDEFSEREIHARTGCMLRSTFWPAKLRWLKRTQPRLFQRVAKWVSPADWIFGELFDTNGTSSSMASATGLCNLAKENWDEELCHACGVDVDLLDKIDNHASGSFRGAKVFNPIGDGAASNLGSGADRPGMVAINFGTSAAVRVIETKPGKLPLGLFRFAIDRDRKLIGGAVSNAGNLRQWCVRELGVDNAAVDRALSRSAAANDSLTVLPFWVQERAPTWPEHQFGVIDGLNQATTAADIVRATATSVFYRLSQILDLIEKAAGRSRRIIVSGGILRSPAAVKLLADALGHDVDLAQEREASLRGAAIYVLSKLEIKVANKSPRKTIKHIRAFAAKHRERRQRQIELEKLLISTR
jgi:gluconokinase